MPDIPALMQEVLKNQRKEEAVRKDYLYHAVETSRETDGHGGVKKTETKEYDIFWVGGVPVQRLVKKDGKELSADEQKKENERIDKEVAKTKEKQEKADSQGKETDPRTQEKAFNILLTSPPLATEKDCQLIMAFWLDWVTSVVAALGAVTAAWPATTLAPPGWAETGDNPATHARINPIVAKG